MKMMDGEGKEAPPRAQPFPVVRERERSFPKVPERHCSAPPHKGSKREGSGQLVSASALIEDLLQVRIQEHSSGVQLLTDATELVKGRVHFLKVLPGAVVGLWKQSEAAGLVLTELCQAAGTLSLH